MNPGGGFVVVWGELLDESLSVRGQVFGADGQPVFERFTVAEDLGDQDVFPRVAVASNSSFVVTFERDTREIRARGFGADTSDLFPEIVVNTTESGIQVTPDVAAHPAGSFVVVWTDDRDENRRRRRRLPGLLHCEHVLAWPAAPPLGRRPLTDGPIDVDRA
jgi:hypothetical protein